MQLREGPFTLGHGVSRRCRVSRRGRVSMRATVGVRDCVSVRRSYRMTVRRTDSVNLVPSGVVAVVSPAMMSAAVVRATVTARKAKEGHGSHAGRTENNAEDVEVHFILDVARDASAAQSMGQLSP